MEGAMNKLTPSLIERVSEVEAATKQAHVRLGELKDETRNDLRFLAGVLGVTLPSDQPRAASTHPHALGAALVQAEDTERRFYSRG